MINLFFAAFVLYLAWKSGQRQYPAGEGGLRRAAFFRKAGWLLEYAVYGAGMIRLTDLIIQGIAGPGSINRALFAVKIMLAESMLLLFPLWKILYGGAFSGSEGIGINPEFILGMFLLLGVTAQAWGETESVRAFWTQAGCLFLFIVFEYLNERRSKTLLSNEYQESIAFNSGQETFMGGLQHASMGGLQHVSMGGLQHASMGGLQHVSMAGEQHASMGGLQHTSMEGPQHRRQEEYLKNVEQQYQRTRELWHDLKNHIKILEILAAEKRFEELTDYLDSFKRDVERRMIPTKTGCAAVDALLGDKLYQAGKQGALMTLHLCDLSEMRLQAVDLCVILGNLLDNALEACAAIPGEGRISLHMKQEEDFYYIRVVNVAEEPVKEGEQYVSGKRDRDNGVGHGLGLRSAERLAHQYGGALVTDYRDGEFTVVVRLQGFQTKSDRNSAINDRYIPNP